MNTLTKLGQGVKGVLYPFLELIHARDPNTRLIHSLSKPLSPNQDKTQDSDESSLDPFASSSKIERPQNILHDFISRKEIRDAALENGISKKLLPNLLTSFAKYYSKSWRDHLDVQVILSDIEKKHGHITDLLPIFLRFAFSHRMLTDNLHITETLLGKFINDYHKNFYDARRIKRKVVFHVGGTNSGKTYQAMQRYIQAESGIYAAPLRMLAYETFVRTNEEGVDCDMLTGEQKKYKISADKPSAHVSCTIEMVPTELAMYKVGVIDEIQMIGDVERGGGWTRALLGLCCEELHICGHYSAVNLTKKLLERTGEEVEVRTYERLTPLTLLKEHLDSDFTKLRPGDCMIAFNRAKLHHLKAQIEAHTEMKCGIIYGHLPPRVRMDQVRLFNDPDSDYQVFVATDAIGLGVNLNIKRIIFDDFHKMWKGTIQVITPQLTNQIAGRAGRYLSLYPDGEITCFHAGHLSLLKRLLSAPIPDIPRAVLDPPSELWANMDYLFPSNDMIQLLRLMNSAMSEHSEFELVTELKLVAPNSLFNMIGVPTVTKLDLLNCFVNFRSDFVTPVAKYMLFSYMEGRLVKYKDVIYSSSWPYPPPVSIKDLDVYEGMVEICDLYLWLHQRSPVSFPDNLKIRELQVQISGIISEMLRRPCFVGKKEVFYLPSSDFVDKFVAYYENANRST